MPEKNGKTVLFGIYCLSPLQISYVSAMIQFLAQLVRFGEMGEKTGWTVLPISALQAQILSPGQKTSFRVKGRIDQVPIRQMALIPMGEGDFILVLKAELRKKLRKEAGATVEVELNLDTDPFEWDPDFLACLEEDPEAQAWFQTLAPSHQRYFSKWIADAKTAPTKEDRIVSALKALRLHWDFGTMIRSRKKDK